MLLMEPQSQLQLEAQEEQALVQAASHLELIILRDHNNPNSQPSDKAPPPEDPPSITRITEDPRRQQVAPEEQELLEEHSALALSRGSNNKAMSPLKQLKSNEEGPESGMKQKRIFIYLFYESVHVSDFLSKSN